MKLKNLYIRFFKSFNYDYLRKNHEKAQFQPWDHIGPSVFPYVRIPIDPKVTAVVGANESGKSHLLKAVPKALDGKGIETEDLCRYSQFASVEQGKLRNPDFGVEFSELEENELATIEELLPAAARKEGIKSFHFFRSQNTTTLYVLSGNGEYETVKLQKENLVKLESILPRIFHIESTIALPDRVSIQAIIDIAEGKKAHEATAGLSMERALAALINGAQSLFDSQEAVVQNAAQISTLVAESKQKVAQSSTDDKLKHESAQLKLAHDLICTIAHVDPVSLKKLLKAVDDRKDGYADGITKEINKLLDEALNFPNWWVQDTQFKLVVKCLERELSFTIVDRTGTHYSFSERSHGLKYFLSYYIQYLAHKPSLDKWEILLMDEPDAYLSSQAQQDLLKIFDSFANTSEDPEKRSIQVIYVTHSPFLIDKNHSERIRVLEKGSLDEGTRVVRDAAKNHYEPLRSAFGAFVGESVFIGNTNVFVEGTADQILLAGVSVASRRFKLDQDDAIDLNRFTIVPAGGTPHIPYLVYLAVGRDVEQPIVVVLLDSDTAGDNAKKVLLEDRLRKRPILPKEFVVQLGALNSEPRLKASTEKIIDLEDLIPIGLCCLALEEYLRTFCAFNEADLRGKIVKASLEELLAKQHKNDLFAAVKALANTLPGNPHVEKVGFARSLVDVLATSELTPDVKQLLSNIGCVCNRINSAARLAHHQLNQEKISSKVKRIVKAYKRDNSTSSTKQDAFELFERIEYSLDDGVESDQIRGEMISLRRDFKIDYERREFVEEYPAFISGLERLGTISRFASQDPVVLSQDRSESPKVTGKPIQVRKETSTAVRSSESS